MGGLRSIPTPTQVLAHEKYQSYMRGWKDGCTARARRREFVEHETRPDLKEEYEAGYEEGMRVRAATQAEVATRIGYKPNVLRTSFQTDDEGVSADP